MSVYPLYRFFRQRAPLFVGALLLCTACKETDTPLGIGNARLAGTWLLYKRSTGPDTNRVVTPIAAMPPQTLTFSGDGRVSAAGAAVSYYRDVKYYRVDSSSGSPQIRLIANVQELPGELQGLQLGRDSLVLQPYFAPTLRLFFVRQK